ncbi:MAG TPA: hypothetical protein VNI61_12690, partial [Gemmatimonadales bacterium]|nr:hypothetical protein [Gemmatimonadales bacterium]
FGLVRPLALGPVRRWTVAARAGSFVDQAAFFGGQRGIVGALALALRTGSATVAELGNDPDVTRVSMDLTLEGAGYVAANSPLPHGSPWAAVALLPGIRVGDPGSSQFTVLLGPTAFLGHRSAVKGFLGVRLELPLARRGGVP